MEVEALSMAVFDILMERTCPRIFDKWRITETCQERELRDFGTSSVDAQLAKLYLGLHEA